MAIKVQPFVIDEAVLDLIGNEFRFDHAKGLAEWLKNSSDAYLREGVPDAEQLIIVRFLESGKSLTQIECTTLWECAKSKLTTHLSGSLILKLQRRARSRQT